MTDFLIDNTALPYPKTNLVSIPFGADSTKYVQDQDWNTVCQGATDLRNFLRAQVPVNLRAVGCVPRDTTKGAANIGIINSLLSAARSASRPIALYADDWFYIDKAGTNWSVRFEEGSVDQYIVGNGRYSSGLIQNGIGTGNDWFGILADRTKRCGMHNIGVMQGEIRMPSAGQHDHLIQIANFGGSSDVGEFSLSSIYLGKALGDCLNFYGGTGIVRATVRDIDIDGYGFVLEQWAPSRAYLFGAYIRNGTTAYYCTTGGTSASGGPGPTGTGAGITDGTCVWSTLVDGATYRFAARSGIAFQRGYDGIFIEGFRVRGIQNSGIDMESTGAGIMRNTHFANGFISNGTATPDPITGHKGNTSTIFSFSGSNTFSDQTQYSSVTNVTLHNGSMQIAETRNARVSKVRVIQDEAPQADTSTACMYVMRGNVGLVLDSIQLHRRGTSAAGELLNIQGTGNVTLSGAWTMEQTTSADCVGGEPSSDIVADGTFNVTYSGSTPASRSVFNFSAISQSINRPKIRGVRLNSTSGAMKALVTLASRAARASLYLAPLTTNCETVVRAKSVGPGGNSITLAFVADGTGAGSLTEAGDVLTFHYQSGVTTVANFETAVAGSTVIEVLISDGTGTLTAPGDTFSAAAFTGGASHSIDDIVINDNHATDGSLLTGAYLSKQAGSIMDVNPIMQGNNFGFSVPLITNVDIGDAPIDEVFPLIDGNKNGPYTLMGTVDPTGKVKAPQGTRYMWLDGDDTKWLLKKETTAKGGWAEVTVGTPSVVAFDLPTDSASWSIHRINNGISSDWNNPNLSYTLQMASGDAPPAIGSLSLIAAGTPAYRVDESSLGYPNADGTWAVGMGENDSDKFATTDAALPDPANTSMFGVWIGRATSTPAAPRSWLQLSDSNQIRMIDSSGRKMRVFAVQNDIIPSYIIDSNFHIWWFLVDETANVCWVGNEGFKSQVGYVGPGTSVKRYGMGAFDENSAPFNCLRKYLWHGSNAEKSLTQIKALVESFGAGVAWTP